jgi:hypothetical protein
VAVRFHIHGFDRPLAQEDALVLAHFLRPSQPGLAEAVRGAVSDFSGSTPIRIEDVRDARALAAAVSACVDLIRTPELDELGRAVEQFLAAGST